MLSQLETLLAQKLTAAALMAPVTEFAFCQGRKWRFDFAWPSRLIAAECEGATWVRGRHTRGMGFENDCEKYAEATLLGWKVFRFTARQIANGYAVSTLRKALSHYDN